MPVPKRTKSDYAILRNLGSVVSNGQYNVGRIGACRLVHRWLYSATKEDHCGAETAHNRCLTAYAAEEVERIKGLPTRDISRVLGYSNGDEVIHRDDLVVLDRNEPGSSESRKLS